MYLLDRERVSYRTKLLLSILLGITLLILFFYYEIILLDDIVNWVIVWVSDPESVAFVILTAGLVYLYRKQTTIQSRQTDILSEQEELMAASNMPVIDVNHIEPLIPSGLGGKTDTGIYLELINVGKGVGICPGIYAGMEIESDKYETKPVFFELKRDARGKSDNIYSELSSSLPPDNKARSYYAPIRVYMKKTGDSFKEYYLSDALVVLYGDKIHKLNFRIGISVSDITGETHDFELFKLDINLEELKETKSFLEMMGRERGSDRQFPFSKVFVKAVSSHADQVSGGGIDNSEWTDKTPLIASRLLEFGAREFVQNDLGTSKQGYGPKPKQSDSSHDSHPQDQGE